MSQTGLLEGLNEAQRLVATSFDSPVCVMAGAGTGKTRALTHRIAYGVHTGAYVANQVLALTFTQKAAQEMASRLRQLGVEGVQARTFHSAALRQLQHFWPTLTDGYLPELVASKASMVAHVLDTMGMEVDSALLRDISSDIEWRKVKGYTTEEYLQHIELGHHESPSGISPATMVDIMTRYEKVKDERRRIDFEDVMLAAVGMLESEPSVLRRVRETYRFFLVDEYQDVAPVQQRLLDVWLGDRTDVCVVGDASQTIYSFAGATSDYLVRFAEAYPDARVIRLEDNYRSSPEIIRAANLGIRGEPGALELRATREGADPLVYSAQPTDEAEAQWVASQVSACLAEGYDLSDIAVLHRFSAQTLATEGALGQAGFSVRQQGGKRFFDQPHVKRAVMEIRGAAVAHTPGPMNRVVDDILFGLGYTPQPPSQQGSVQNAWEDLRAISQLAEAFGPTASLQEFSEELIRRERAHDEPTLDAVTLTTVHAAKGQEWPIVFVVGLAEGLFPISYARGDEQRAEERRLFYVAMTRAKNRLYLSWAKRSKASGAERTISGFLSDIGIGP